MQYRCGQVHQRVRGTPIVRCDALACFTLSKHHGIIQRCLPCYTAVYGGWWMSMGMYPQVGRNGDGYFFVYERVGEASQ